MVSATEAHSADDIANVVVGHGLRVRDLATVKPGTADRVNIISGNGRPVAQLNITRQLGGNTLAIADSVAGVARALAHTLPPGVRLTPVYDQAALVRDAVTAVRDAMLIGAALAVVVLLLFLRHGRITAVSASSIPLTLVITIFVMWLFGQTFNLMTLGAMAIAIGLVIDDAVVITENIVRHLDLNPDRTAAIRDAVQELLWPVTTSTLTTVVVFLPLGLLQGVVGQFFHALSITLTIAVLVSLGLACSVIPLLSQRYLGPRDAEHAPPPPGPAPSWACSRRCRTAATTRSGSSPRASATGRSTRSSTRSGRGRRPRSRACGSSSSRFFRTSSTTSRAAPGQWKSSCSAQTWRPSRRTGPSSTPPWRASRASRISSAA